VKPARTLGPISELYPVAGVLLTVCEESSRALGAAPGYAWTDAAIAGFKWRKLENAWLGAGPKPVTSTV
jgi:hypothetical protein